jgi:hypothetical protein
MAADDTLAAFKGGIGVHPVSNGVNDDGTATTAARAPSVTRNIVRGVQPAGQLWVIDRLEARVRANSHIRVDGKGLILAGGNNAGRATGQMVFATLICEAAAPFTEFSSTLTGVPLSASGDFVIDDVLSATPAAAFPFQCASPMLLIRTAGSGNWFAVGIPSGGN